MRQLSALDAWLLDLESPTATGHVGTLVGVDPSDADGWGTDRVRALLESRLQTVGSLSRRLVGGPLGLGDRYLVDDPSFDIEFHVRELALPAPGTTQQLADQVAAIHGRPLDRSRPMWELHVVTGLEYGRAAVYAKVHRTLIDEVSGAEVLQALLDLDPEPTFTGPEPTPAGTAAPSALDLLRHGLRALADDPRQLGYVVPDSLHRLGRFAGDAGLPGARVVGALAETAGRLLGPGSLGPGARDVSTPRTRLDAPLTPHRRLAVGSVPMDDVTRLCDRSGMTTQGVVLAMTAAALRRWLLDHDALPPTPLVAVLPVPVRADDASGHARVRMAPALVELPTHLRGATDRESATRDAMDAATEQLDAPPPTAMDDLVAASPTALSALAARTLSGSALAPGTSANLAVAHLPGPAVPLYLAGARVEQIVPVSALGGSTGGLAVTSYSYDGRLHLGVTACREIVPDVWHLVGYLTEALDELLAAGE